MTNQPNRKARRAAAAQSKKPMARAAQSPLGWRIGGVQDKAGALYMRPCGATRQDVADYGLLPCLNMVNAPASVPPQQTVIGRGHMAWTAGDKGHRTYFVALCLKAIPKGAKVPPYYKSQIAVVDGDGGDIVTWTKAQLRDWLKARDGSMAAGLVAYAALAALAVVYVKAVLTAFAL